ncbi:MAG: TIGR00730 family Rossman fold protein, partial [Pseudomonadota bacterium]
MPDPNQNICIFAGSRAGFRPAYADAARALVQAIAAAGHGVVYGGGNVGLMNVAAEEGLRLGIPVIGVIPRSLVEREVVRRDLSELHIVDDMLSRKALMAERAAGYVALPGGIGTLDEILEMVTWTQLDFQTKRCGLLDVDGFYRPFVAVLE